MQTNAVRPAEAARMELRGGEGGDEQGGEQILEYDTCDVIQSR